MMATQHKNHGLALVLVMIILATTAVTSLSYLATASISMAACEGHADAVRARQLAESGVSHAICLIRENPDMLIGSDMNPLGPFPVDDRGDGYTISVAETALAGQLEIVCQGTSGRSTQTVAAIVSHSLGVDHKISHAMLSGGPYSIVPWSVQIDGDMHVNGSAYVMGQVKGDLSASGMVLNFGDVQGEVRTNATPVEMPRIEADEFDEYVYGELPGSARQLTTNLITRDHPVNRGRAVSDANPAGVVVCRPSGGSLWLWEKLNFTGTLVVHGDVVIDGWNMNLKAQEGFPAIVTTGRVFVTQYANKVDVEGLVYAAGGVYPYGDTRFSETSFRGGVVCASGGFASSLRGSHKVEFDSKLADIMDPSGGGTGGDVEILRWEE